MYRHFKYIQLGFFIISCFLVTGCPADPKIYIQNNTSSLIEFCYNDGFNSEKVRLKIAGHAECLVHENYLSDNFDIKKDGHVFHYKGLHTFFGPYSIGARLSSEWKTVLLDFTELGKIYLGAKDPHHIEILQPQPHGFPIYPNLKD